MTDTSDTSDTSDRVELDAPTIQTMIDTGSATIPDLACHFKRTIQEVNEFLNDNDVAPPGMHAEQYRYMRKFFAAERPSSFDHLDLVYDDPAHLFINGIDTVKLNSQPDAISIVQHYNRDQKIVCPFTNEPTTSVMMLDGNPSNFLVTNIMPITEKAFGERFEESPVVVSGQRYRFVPEKGIRHYDITLGIDLCGRFDRKYGALFKEEYMTAIVNQWVRPYFERIDHSKILPDGFPTTAELMSLWLWRHLSTVAQLKGLARIELSLDAVQSFMTKDTYLGIVGQELKKVLNSRHIVQASPQATHQGAPAIITP